MKTHGLFMSAFLLLAGCAAEDMADSIPVIPVHIVGIEAVNIDNAGRYPSVTDQAIKKEAYMLGIKWLTDDADPDGSQYVTPGVTGSGGGYYYEASLSAGYQKRIYSVGAFNASNPAGSNVSQYFKQIDYLPDNVDEGLVLLVSPDPGEHSFRVVFYQNNAEAFECVTPTVNLQ